MEIISNHEAAAIPSENFGSIRAGMFASIASIRSIAEQRNDAHVIAELEVLQEKLRANRFYLAVLGQFKRGKTTLINSLLGADVLPVGVVPLTSIITMLSYGTQPEVTVHFLSGETLSIQMQELEDYVTESHNPQNAKGVKHVDVRYPSSYLKDGMLLVDTPGIGSTYQHNTEVTQSFLARVDAAIFLVSVDPPLTLAEAEFLRRTKEEVHQLFFVLNKIDLMTEPEMRESLAFTCNQITAQTGINPVELFPMSARTALAAKKTGDAEGIRSSGLEAFESALRSFLMKDKGFVLLESSLADILRIAGGIRFSIELEVKAASVPVADLQHKQKVLEVELGQIEQERSDMNVLLASEINRLVAAVESDLNQHVEESAPSVHKRLHEFYADHLNAGRSQIGRLLDDFMREQVEAVFNAWRLKEDEKMSRLFSAMSSRFTGKTNAIIRSIRLATSRLFDIGVETFDSPETLRADTHLYYQVDPLFYFAIDKIPFALPKFLFRSYVLSKMHDKIKQELYRNAGRIRYDYLQRIEKSTNEFRGALNLKIDATLSGIRCAIERAVAATQSSSVECEQQIRSHRQHSEALGCILERSRTLAAHVAAQRGELRA